MASIMSKVLLIGAIASMVVAQSVESAITTIAVGVITSSDGTIETVTAIAVSSATGTVVPATTGFSTYLSPAYPTAGYTNVTGSATATYLPGNATTGFGYPSGTGTGGYPPYYTGPIAIGGADSVNGKGLAWGGIMAAAVGFAMGF
ncbi:hypothetical protein K431DRAFT_65586 [Polychaeton citri CBS 116435]|uniref:Uncharacterized protein n=1 Tax=Polychaeton citri CBS 116435 TaxID=1314669 RepID=A0A9P4QBA5_9PEZI|nr:hypothetical protein K431DRAFT_65586 [Polychaeton citri CBS 116435]